MTEMVLAHAAPAVTVVPFTQRAEALSGADWVWWWIDSFGAYGMLVQAKRLTVTKHRWSFKFDYHTKGSTRLQRESLVEAAATLRVLPVHALYLGTGDYRHWAPCPGKHWKSRCPECMRRTVSLMPALLADDSMVDDAVSTYERSVALEDLWKPPSTGAFLIPALQRAMSPDLARFLKARPDGTRAVVRSMVDRVLKVRAGQLSPVATSVERSAAAAHDDLGPVFQGLPADTMHGGVRYLDHVLNPLTYSPPDYVLEVIARDRDLESLQNQMPDNVGGIVVIRTPRLGAEENWIP
ncbi:hypothetical protein [Microbacterium luteum]|uniref:hypothetical protein n=1 Tax=Microbacterium luteum TaxID=2782167 RepID=UPI001E56CC0B|nr:hypothetical protein [Microbacterium luteum]